MSDTFGAIDTSLDRIAWLEAERDSLTARITELEAERDRLKAALRVAGIRIASLEAADEATLSDPSGE